MRPMHIGGLDKGREFFWAHLSGVHVRRAGLAPSFSAETNAKQRGVNWQFKIDDARRKLKQLYPKIKT